MSDSLLAAAPGTLAAADFFFELDASEPRDLFDGAVKLGEGSGGGPTAALTKGQTSGDADILATTAVPASASTRARGPMHACECRPARAHAHVARRVKGENGAQRTFC